MSSIKGLIVTVGVAGLAGFLAYQFLLTPEAKVSLAQAATTTKKGYLQIKEALDSRYGTVVREETLPNVEQTKHDWEVLGF